MKFRFRHSKRVATVVTYRGDLVVYRREGEQNTKTMRQVRWVQITQPMPELVRG